MNTCKFLKFGIACISAASALMLSTGCAGDADDPSRRQLLTRAKDDVRLIAGLSFPGGMKKHPAAILVHQLGESSETMTTLVKPLIDAGFVVINLDMRGHGLSINKGKILISSRNFSNKDWAMVPSDLNEVVKNAATLPNVDANKIAVIGVSIGANAALVEAAGDPKVKAVVAISPGLNFHDLSPAAAMPNLKRIPVLLIATKPDQYSADSATKLSKMDPGSSLKIFESGGHGYQMLVTHREINSDIATWLHKAMP